MTDWSPDIALLAAFDDAEWARVERVYVGRLLAYIARRVPDAEAREDVVQEVFLGAVRGIDRFDAAFTFEQYLFGICRNRTIDHLRRRAVHGVGVGEGEDEHSSGSDDVRLEDVESADPSPSRAVRADDLAQHGRALLAHVLRDWVQETWAAGEFKRLMVVEALFRGGWRNRDTWVRFDLRDETAVAGIKFRALKRMRALAAERDPSGLLADAWGADEAAPAVAVDVADVWARARVSCPARHWLARSLAGTLPTEPDGGPAAFVGFHVDEVGCAVCQANRDDLARQDEAALEPLLANVRASTLGFLRSRTLP